jgi:hypothetical protein
MVRYIEQMYAYLRKEYYYYYYYGHIIIICTVF